MGEKILLGTCLSELYQIYYAGTASITEKCEKSKETDKTLGSVGVVG